MSVGAGVLRDLPPAVQGQSTWSEGQGAKSP